MASIALVVMRAMSNVLRALGKNIVGHAFVGGWGIVPDGVIYLPRANGSLLFRERWLNKGFIHVQGCVRWGGGWGGKHV